jgi:hypothetical protein
MIRNISYLVVGVLLTLLVLLTVSFVRLNRAVSSNAVQIASDTTEIQNIVDFLKKATSQQQPAQSSAQAK